MGGGGGYGMEVGGLGGEKGGRGRRKKGKEVGERRGGGSVVGRINGLGWGGGE